LDQHRPLPDGEDPVAAEEDLEDLYENAPCGYLSLLSNGRIVRVNQTLLRWIGHEREALIGTRFHDLLHVAGKIYYETHFAPLLRMQGFFNEVALDLVCHDGKRLPVLVNAIERQAASGAERFIRVTVFNATDRRRYEQELLLAKKAAEDATRELQALNATLEERVREEVEERTRAEEALRQAQKMEAIGQLTGGVAHDFNNLLTVIMGGLETIARQLRSLPEGAAETGRITRALAMAQQGAQRAAALTARLLAFARRQPLDPKPIEASRLVSGLADLLQRTLGETIALETVSGAGLWKAQADPGELENALINLAVNARDAMPNGGRLTIETTNAYLDESYVDELAEPVPAGQYVLIAVSDTGVGMSQETLERIFEPFFTTKEAGKGTGLGLSQVYGFVRQTGGHIRVYSELGHGTTVKIYLPRLTTDEAPMPARPPAPEAALQGGEDTILVVEDHDDLRAYSCSVLRELGYHVLEAVDARTALELLQTERVVDLVFTDVILPGGIDGRRLADEARRVRPGIKILYTSGYTRNAIVHNDRLDRDVDLIGKPFTFQTLAAKVRSVLDR
jgi:PAS domain S-box-containing protein